MTLMRNSFPMTSTTWFAAARGCTLTASMTPATTRIPILGPFIVIFSVLGTYTVSYSMLDVWVTLISGVAGYFMRKFGFPVIPVVLAAILGPQIEIAFNQSLHIGYGSALVILTRPLALVFMVLAVSIVTWTGWRELRQRRLRVEEQD